jgi:hypothetical protein
MRFLRAALCLALPLLLSGCIFFETKADRAMRSDPNFQQGYDDGCASANARGSNYRGDTVRDDNLYQNSRPYRAGWGQGATACNTRLNTPANPNNVGADGRTLP